MTIQNQRNQTALRTSGIAAIMGDLTDYFDQCDQDHDGRIFYKEFLVLLKCLGGSLAPRDWHAEFQSIDTGSRTSIDVQDFFTWWMK